MKYAIAALMICAGVHSAYAADLSEIEKAAIAHECAQVLYKYSYAQDMRDADGITETFADNGVWQSGQSSATGREAIAAKAKAYMMSEGYFTSRHVISNVIIDVKDRDHASGTAYISDYFYDPKKLSEAKFIAPVLIGIYSNEYVRTAKGWRLASMKFTRDAANFDRPKP